MIKVIENNHKTTPSKIQYPCLMKSIQDEALVLFTDMTSGTVIIDSEIYKYGVGKFDNDWNIENFKPIDYPITLENL